MASIRREMAADQPFNASWVMVFGMAMQKKLRGPKPPQNRQAPFLSEPRRRNLDLPPSSLFGPALVRFCYFRVA
jgi:hypothetical protein